MFEFVSIGEADGGQVVGERVEPDVDRVVLGAGERNPPGNPAARSGDVLQASLEEPQDLVAPARGPHEFGVRPDVIQEAVAIG